MLLRGAVYLRCYASAHAFAGGEEGVLGIMGVLIIFAATFLIALFLWKFWRRRKYINDMREFVKKRNSIPKAWLLKQMTVAEAESLNLVHDERLGPQPIPFGFSNESWQSLLAKMRPGDEVWQFSSPVESWEDLSGRMGYAVVRDGEVIEHIVTLMN